MKRDFLTFKWLLLVLIGVTACRVSYHPSVQPAQLDTLSYRWNAPAHQSRPVKGMLVDGVFREMLKPDEWKSFNETVGSSWMVTDSLTLAKYGLGPDVGLVAFTTKEYEKVHGKPAEVLAQEKAQAQPRNPRIPHADDAWLVSGADRLDSLPTFQGGDFDKFHRWIYDHGQQVRAADPKRYGSIELTFVIDKDGRICSPHIVRGLSEKTDSAMVEHLLNAPAWQPAIKAGQSVPVVLSCSLPVEYLIR